MVGQKVKYIPKDLSERSGDKNPSGEGHRGVRRRTYLVWFGKIVYLRVFFTSCLVSTGFQHLQVDFSGSKLKESAHYFLLLNHNCSETRLGIL